MTLSPGRAMLLGTVKEAQWQRQVIEWAHRAGWLVHHVHDSRKEEWGTDAGFPDLVLARAGRVLFVELKKAGGRLSAAQKNWRLVLPGYYVWRPADENEVRRVLA